MEIPFLKARYFFSPATPRQIDLVVIHAAEIVPTPGGAEWLMRYCAANDRKASWHYAVDSDSVTQSVREADIAYHAGRKANTRGIGIELATKGTPAAALWADTYHQKMLTMAEWLVAGICRRHRIEPFFVDAAGLMEGRRGVTTHAHVSLAFHETDHTDPGPDFPVEAFLAKVKARLDSGNFQVEGQS